MTPPDHDSDPPREPIRVTPVSGRDPARPAAARAGLSADVATASLLEVLHELNNLLDGAARTLSLARQSLGELALAPGLDPAVLSQMDTASTALGQMADLLHTALRPDAGGALGQRHNVALIETITHALEVHRPLARERRIELIAEVSPRLVLTPAGPIYPALANVIRNAIDAISAARLGGRVEVVAEMVTAESGEPNVWIDIVDDGPGPTDAARARALDPGFTERPEGFGIGLSLARRIVSDLGGTLVFDARSPDDPIRPGGRGAHVRIRYPLPT